MSKQCLEFLCNSFLYQSDLSERNYDRCTDEELISELQKYRDFVISGIDEIRGEINEKNGKLNVCVETFSEFPTVDLYKQLILYMDQVVIPDPLFEQTEKKSTFSNAMQELIGLKKSEKIDRRNIREAIEYIKCISPMLDDGFVVMLPLTLMHEAPKEIPITYSPTAFADVLPQAILEYYRSLVEVRNLEKCEAGLRIRSDMPLTLGTGIYVEFPDDERHTGSFYQYMSTEVFEFDEKTGRAKIGYRVADTITENEFWNWVNQSINQVANHHFSDKYKELIFAQKCGCMYLSQSALTANILSMAIEKPKIEAELATMAMQVNLPVVNQIPITDLLSIRNNHGEAFHNFRTELNAKLLSLDNVEDSDKMHRQIASISYELNNVQVKEVEKEYRKIARTLKLDMIAISGSLIASFTTGGLTAIGAAAAFVKCATDVGKYYTNVNENNGFFLWKLKKQAQKYTA